MEQNAFSLLDTNWLAVAQALSVDGVATVVHFPRVPHRIVIRGCRRTADRRATILLLLRGCEVGFPLVCGQKDLLIVPSRVASRLHPCECKLPRECTAV